MHNKKIYFSLILILGLLLRIYQLANQSYWIDELVSVHFSSHPMWQALFWDNHFAVYPLLLKAWIYLWGDSEIATRSLSVLFSMLSLYVVTRLFENKTTQLIAALLLAINPISILMAQETRPYALLELLLLITLVLALKAKAYKTRASIAALLLTITLSVLTHYLAIIPLVYALIIWGLTTQSLAKRMLFITACILIGGISLHIISWQPLEWQKYKFAQSSAIWDYGLIFLKLTGWILVLYLPLSFNRKFELSHSMTKAIYLFTPSLFLGLIFAGFFTERNFALDRYFTIAVPFVVYTIASFVGPVISAHHRFAKTFFFSLVLVSVFITSQKNYQNFKAPWRELAQTFKDIQPCPEIFTTRSLAINSPYFKKLNCEVKKLESIQQIVDRLSVTNQSLYIVDNYWGATPYLITLQNEIESRSVAKIDVQIFQKQESDILYLVKISPWQTQSK